jgi:hypothetical protein
MNTDDPEAAPSTVDAHASAVVACDRCGSTCSEHLAAFADRLRQLIRVPRRLQGDLCAPPEGAP